MLLHINTCHLSSVICYYSYTYLVVQLIILIISAGLARTLLLRQKMTDFGTVSLANFTSLHHFSHYLWRITAFYCFKNSKSKVKFSNNCLYSLFVEFRVGNDGLNELDQCILSVLYKSGVTCPKKFPTGKFESDAGKSLLQL